MKDLNFADPTNLFLNTRKFGISGVQQYRSRDVGFTTIKPEDVDYEVEIKIDLLSVFSLLQFEQRGGKIISSHGAADAWRFIKDHIPQAPSVTRFHDNVSPTYGWETFWSGIVSESINQCDRTGNSINLQSIQDALNTDNQLLSTISYSMSRDFNGGTLDAHEYFFASLAQYIQDVRSTSIRRGDTIGIYVRSVGEAKSINGLILLRDAEPEET